MSRLSLSLLYRILFFAFLCVAPLCAEHVPKLLNLSYTQGLSQNSVWSILRDRQGFMWFGTDDGLNKFDGYTFKIYRHDKRDSTSLLHNTVRALLQDHTGLIWIGTSGGVNVLDPVTGRLTAYRYSPDDPAGLSGELVTRMVEDNDGNIWVGTHMDGLCKFDRSAKKFKVFTGTLSEPNTLPNNSVTALYADHEGVIWVGTVEGGISRYNASDETFTVYAPGKKGSGFPDASIYSFFEDSKGRFWVGTRRAEIFLFDRTTGRCTAYGQAATPQNENLDSLTVLTICEDRSGRIVFGTFGGGLKFLDPVTGRVTVWRKDIVNAAGLCSDQITSLYSDSLENLWIGTYTGGINKYDPHGEHFQTFRNENPHFTMLTDNNVRSLFRDRHGNIWIGTMKGLNIMHPSTGVCEHYQNDPRNPYSLNENFVSAIYEDKQGTYWIGTRRGLHTFDPKTKRFKRYLAANSPGMRNDYIRQLHEDRRGVLWIATLDGLLTYDRAAKKFTCYTYDPADSGSISNNNIRSICEARDGTLWFGTYGGGLDRFDCATGKFQHFVHDPKNPNSISADLAAPVVEDKEGNIWTGTYAGGLNRLNPKTGVITVFTENDGLCNNTIFGIQVSAGGNLWISTNNGISCFDPSTRLFKNYSTASGLQGEEYNLNSSFQDKDGTLFFGGTNGFNIFHPDKIYDNTVVPPVYITGLNIFNRPYDSDTAVSIRKVVRLPYDQNSLSFDFVSLNYRKPELNQYKYILQGFDKEWSPATTARRASYTNLPPGTYVFKVIGSNNDGVWNNAGVSMCIVIAPPFWKTWWAYTSYAVILITLFVLIMMYVQRRERRKLLMDQQRREAELIRQRNIKLKEANDEILRHQEILRERSQQIEWTNAELKEEIVVRQRTEDQLKTALGEKEVLLKEIHHRVKNNLTIVGSLLSMQSDSVTDDNDRQLFHEAKSRVITMAQIHEKLYQSKNLADLEFGEYIRGVAAQLFHAYNNGNASLRISAEKVKFGVDTAIPCGLIINELITNSLKYAFPDGVPGMVFVELRTTPGQDYEVIVGDTGIGFPEGLDFRTTETMGMTLVRALVKQLNGTIELDSDRGAKFIIRFSADKNGENAM
jgi:ligand-binding sensor domain-containing protein/two-component sensor histidine kinase